MKHILQRNNHGLTNPSITNWRIDDDGFLRITARIIKEGVYPYASYECEGEVREALPDVDPIMEYIPAKAFTEESLASLEGKPVTIPYMQEGEDWHQWRDAQNTLKDCLTVGNIAGKPTLDGEGGIICDMLIMDENAIQKITEEQSPDKKLVEVSAGYSAMFSLEGGSFNGKQYHGVQGDLSFNHVLLLPKGTGRCGYEVRIINSNGDKQQHHQGDEHMPTTLKVTVGNKPKTVKFNSEEDALKAEEMLEEQKSFNAEELTTAIQGKEELEAQVRELQEQLDDKLKVIKEAQDQIASIMSPEAQEKMAEELLEQKEDEEIILNTEAETDATITDKEKEQISNALLCCKNRADRRATTVSFVMNKRNVKEDVSSWSQEKIDGAFSMLAMNAKKMRTTSRLLNGGRGTQDNTTPLNNREKMLSAVKRANAPRANA